MNAKTIFARLSAEKRIGILRVSNLDNHPQVHSIIYLDGDILRRFEFDHDENVRSEMWTYATKGEFDLLEIYVNDCRRYGIGGLKDKEGHIIFLSEMINA